MYSKEKIMAHIVGIANQKGGVGKTSTALALGAALSLSSKKILFNRL
jgi:chromosome partitioning protein